LLSEPRSERCIKDAQKLGRSPPLAFDICYLGTKYHKISAYKVNFDTIEKAPEHFRVLFN